MIKKSTVISRFGKLVGELKPSKTGLFITGELDFYGLTTNLEEISKNFLKKYYSENLSIPQVVNVDGDKFCSDYTFIIGNDETSKTEVAFTEDRLIAGYHILDSKPFERLMIRYYPNCSLPISASRNVEGEIFSVLIAPFEMPYYHGNPWLTDKVELRWLRQLPNQDTFWLVEYDKYNRRGVKVGIEQMVKCYNCTAELDLLTYAKQILDRSHPQCFCVCSTYDDFCGCIRNRLYAQMMTQTRALSRQRMLLKKQIS